MSLVLYFVAGFFAWNSIPHLVKGITGQSHMTPFKRVSPPVLNVVWSFINVVFTLVILKIADNQSGLAWPWEKGLAGMNLAAFLIGGFICAVYLANFWSNSNARLPWHKD